MDGKVTLHTQLGQNYYLATKNTTLPKSINLKWETFEDDDVWIIIDKY